MHWLVVTIKLAIFAEFGKNISAASAKIGMDKNYHYDKNLFCTSPPFFPAVEYDDGTGEIGVSLTSFKKIN